MRSACRLEGATHLGVHRDADGEEGEAGVEVVEGAGVRGPARERAAELAQLEGEQRRAAARAALAHERRDRLLREGVEHRVVADARRRALGILVQAHQP